MECATLVSDTITALRKERLLRVSRRDGGVGPSPSTAATATATATNPAANNVTANHAANNSAANLQANEKENSAVSPAAAPAVDAATRPSEQPAALPAGDDAAEEVEVADGRPWSPEWQLKVSRLGTAAVKGEADSGVCYPGSRCAVFRDI